MVPTSHQRTGWSSFCAFFHVSPPPYHSLSPYLDHRHLSLSCQSIICPSRFKTPGVFLNNLTLLFFTASLHYSLAGGGIMLTLLHLCLHCKCYSFHVCIPAFTLSTKALSYSSRLSHSSQYTMILITNCCQIQY